MKNFFLGLAVMAGSFTFAQQKTSTLPVTFGVKAGVNFSAMSKGGGMEDRDGKVGFNAGAFANIPVAGSFSVQPEILYSQYGGKFSQTLFGKKYSFVKNLDYITIPVMLQYNVLPNFYLEAGPEFGILVSAKNKLKSESNNNIVTDGDVKQYTNGFNMGIGIGAGYYFTPQFGATLRYMGGLTNIYKNNSEDKVKTGAFQLGLAYKFK
ncbi:Outer membrane protein beta-barrel domain-containing protein [Chryseobacterium sp. RU37D]|uniref:porin family protein n=1 Tax=Chryseobacterium sp. RU37D TaxID=1907397 RepID=UPI0009564197|nr:porin family protein [Chryseobacterium sp. RU37D]SIQ82100.1 Outer membrane protein beta-barrel domain-containing protein [Chryseobacterium sp. RU37D]